MSKKRTRKAAVMSKRGVGVVIEAAISLKEGDHLEIGGEPYEVVAIFPKPKRAVS